MRARKLSCRRIFCFLEAVLLLQLSHHVAVAQPSISKQPQSQYATVGLNAQFTVTAGGISPFSYQWQFNGANVISATNSSLSLTNVQFTNAGIYRVVVTNNYGSVTSTDAVLTVGTLAAWGYGFNNTRTNVPLDLTNALAIAAGQYHSIGLKPDGTVSAWGDNNYGQTNVPAGLSNVTAIAAGYSHNLALRKD